MSLFMATEANVCLVKDVMVLVSLELGECVVSWTATHEIREVGIHTRGD